jgi:3-oxoacyl-[acyl-carrier protein] reductase
MRAQRWGRVVTITSCFGREGGGRPWFNVAKTAQTALMKSLALRRDLVRDGVTFNSVAPGAIMIPDTGWEAEREKDPAAFAAMVDREFPLGRLGTPDEVAHVVAMVCSAHAGLLNGASIAVDGGETRSF